MQGRVHRDMFEAYLRRNGFDDAKIVAFEALGTEVQEDLKAHSYGRPVRARFITGGQERDVVIRTAKPDAFGHERRADRVYQMALAFDTFRKIPNHIQALDAGLFDDEGAMISMARGEPFLITDYVEGSLYAHDLKALEGAKRPQPLDLERARALATYLADLHKDKALHVDYERRIRDTIGDGEGIFGITDGYPEDLPVASPQRLRAIEKMCVDWRWLLKGRTHRSRRTHGDFHPFNILFREGADLSVLDASRGGVGEPADDLTCLSINYLFFSLVAQGQFEGALRYLWDEFWSTYLDASGDQEILEVVAPFFTWRALVLACPAWYPSIDNSTRDRMLRFAECLLSGAPFSPDRVGELCR